MTSVNVTTEKSSVELTGNQRQVTVTDITASKTVEVPSAGTSATAETVKTSVVKAVTAGPQGPQGNPGNFNLSDSAKVNQSVIYYDASAGSYKADATWTTSTLTFGGNF